MDAARIGPVVVGVDASGNARRALVLAGEWADRLGAPLVVVHAVGLTEEIGGERVPTHDRHEELVALLDEWCDDLRASGRDRFEQRLIDGAPVDVVLRVAADEGASAIVIGRRGVGGQPELRLGSTAHQIVEHAHCPVVVIPPQAAEAGTGA